MNKMIGVIAFNDRDFMVFIRSLPGQIVAASPPQRPQDVVIMWEWDHSIITRCAHGIDVNDCPRCEYVHGCIQLRPTPKTAFCPHGAEWDECPTCCH